MGPAPARIGGARVVAYTTVGARGLAICEDDGGAGFYLFGCNERWESITDTWHLSVEEAKRQAEHEHEGRALAWIDEG